MQISDEDAVSQGISNSSTQIREFEISQNWFLIERLKGVANYLKKKKGRKKTFH